MLVAHRGREPGLMLETGNAPILLKDWAEQIFADMKPLCELMDGDNPEKPYTSALQRQWQLVQNPELTPSARILQQMVERNKPFASLALLTSAEHERYFREQKLDDENTRHFMEMARASLAKQKEIEDSDRLTFDDFLQHYFSQN